jgi:tetratricopeptide (TPR) repeat protein
MTRGGKLWRALAAAAALAAMWAGSVATQRQVDREAGLYRESPDLLWVTSPRTVKALSLGHEGLLANIYWTRAVQHYGRRLHDNRPDYGLLYPLLDITTTLDPHLLIAYYFGSFFLAQRPPIGAGSPEQAIELLNKGIKANPDNWRFYHFIGFIYYWDLQDYEKAAAAYLEGAKNPAAHPWMRVMAAQITERGGSRETSFFLWSQIYNSTTDVKIRENALGHMQGLQAQKDIEDLEALARAFRERTGRWPSSFGDMIAAGLLREPPRDPTGLPYEISADGAEVSVALHPESKVKLEYGFSPKPPPRPAI